MTSERFVIRRLWAGARLLLGAGSIAVPGLVLDGPSAAVAQGAGDLVVAPTRVVLEGRTRTAQLTLLNKGSATATYRISAINMRMEEDGTVREIQQPDPGQNFATKLFRYSPRQVTLKPGAAQAVRILLRKPKNLADGEYRSHMFFRGVPEEAGESVEQAGSGDSISVKLIPIYGISIPVIIRHGKTEANVSLSDLRIAPPDGQNQTPRLKFRINREGTSSAFGDLVASYETAGGEDVIIGQIMRLAIYTPNRYRTVEMRLRVPDGVSLSGGNINLTFKQTEDAGGRLMAKADLAVP